jgi:hypothetical protein
MTMRVRLPMARRLMRMYQCSFLTDDEEFCIRKVLTPMCIPTRGSGVGEPHRRSPIAQEVGLGTSAEGECHHGAC